MWRMEEFLIYQFFSESFLRTLQIFRRHNYLLHELQIQASRKEVFMISVKKMVVSSHITSGLKILDTIYSKLGIFSDLFYNHSLIQEKMSVESP